MTTSGLVALIQVQPTHAMNLCPLFTPYLIPSPSRPLLEAEPAVAPLPPHLMKTSNYLAHFSCAVALY